MSADEPDVGRVLRVATWNVAAVNNNPFEYFITHHDPAYDQLMKDVEAFMDYPGENDVRVGDLIDDAMFEELLNEMRGAGFEGVDATSAYWHARVKPRKIVSEFLKDKDVGAKRLCSAPDRVTNTITSLNETLYRPSIINCYDADLPDVRSWFAQWKQFMFHTAASVATRTGDAVARKVCQLLEPIARSKYPAITEAEEKISIPLQTACLAVFDAILVHILNRLAPGKWHAVKFSIIQALNANKTRRTLEILGSAAYRLCDVICVQEAAASFVKLLENHPALGRTYHVLAPATLDGRRDQNSLILASKARFDVRDAEWRGEVTSQIIDLISRDAPASIAAGDLFAVRCVERGCARDDDGGRYVLASFHGDTNGLATLPVIDALDKHALLLDVNRPAPNDEDASPRAAPRFVLGMDANTHVDHAENERLGVSAFAAHLERLGLATCWGVFPDPRAHTTFNSRTSLQPQMNKAVRFSERATSALTDKHPKDHIVYRGDSFTARLVARDNTGEGEFIDDVPFPTLAFPSDHALVCAELVKR
jgi:hypothetical protein